MRLSILWRIMEIEEGVIRRGRRPRRITPSEISIIFHMIRKPNSIIVYYSFKIIPSLKTWLKYAYLHRSIDVEFIFDIAPLGLFSSTNILQIADVALRVVFLLFLPCYYVILFRVVLTLEKREMSAIFVSTTKTTQPRPQVFINLQKRCGFDVISSLNTKFFQIWSSVTGYGELCACF